MTDEDTRMDKDTTDFLREREFADHTATIKANEIVAGRYGRGVVQDIQLGDEVDRVFVELPHGETATISLDSRPATSQSRAHAFFEWVGVDPDRQLDAVGERLPCVVYNGEDGDVWLPVFPAKNSRRSFFLFRTQLFLCRIRVSKLKTDFKTEPNKGHKLQPAGVSLFLIWSACAGIVWSLAPLTGWLASVTVSAVGGLALLAMIDVFTTAFVSTRDTYDLRSPGYDPPSWVTEDDADE